MKLEGLEEILFDLCLERYDSLDVSEIASQAILESVDDVESEIVRKSKDETEVKGTAVASYTLEYGGGGDDGASVGDSYPLTFHLILDSEENVSEVKELVVDVSSFYGDPDD